jgi:hypothetical protein
MNRTPVFEDDLNDWLEDGPTDAPQRVVDTVLAAFPSIPQRRVVSRAPWRLPLFAGYAPALAWIAAVAVVAIGGTLLINRPSSNQVGGPSVASASPSASPSFLPQASAAINSIDTSTWKTFTSARHGITVRYPADWSATKATAPWPAGVDPVPSDPRHPADPTILDTFRSPGTDVSFFVASQPLPTGVTNLLWLTNYEAAGVARDPANPECWPTPAKMARATVDGLPAWTSTGCGTNDAFIFAGGRVFLILESADPFYNYPLFEAFLSTVAFDPAQADDTPVARPRSSPGPS